MSNDFAAANPHSPVLRFAAMIKAARDFGLDQRAVNAVALTFDPRQPELVRIGDALAEALLARRPFESLDTA